MSNEFVTFRVFADQDIARDFASILDNNNLPYRVEEDALSFDVSYAFNPLNKDYRIRLRQEDFDRATEIFNKYFNDQLDTLPADYYLFEFTTLELKEIITKPDEWGNLDYMLAQKLLSERGETVTANELASLKLKRKVELSKPEKTDWFMTVMGYILSVFLPLIGVIVGLMISSSKKTLPDGQVVFTYNADQRFHGKVIIAISIVGIVMVAIGAFFGVSIPGIYSISFL